MPVALHLGNLYEQLLLRLIPLPVRAQETLAELVVRTELATTKRREIERTQAKLKREKQFKRKVEINAELRKLRTELSELKETQMINSRS